MSNRFHNKFHRQNHHSDPTVGYPDSAFDPIASFEQPFKGEFYSQGDIITTQNLSAGVNLNVTNNANIFGTSVRTPNIGTGEDNSVVVLNASGYLKTDEINPGVWDTTMKFVSASDGALTVNRLTKATDSTGINESIVFDNGTNVGIGTDTPTEKLDVNGSAIVRTNLTVNGDFTVLGTTSQLDTLVYTTSAVSITNAGTGPALTVTQTGSQPIAHFIDSNGDDIIFADNGYVGLGVSSPSEKLTVSGNLSTSGTATIGTIADNTTGTSVVIESDGLLQKRTLNVAAFNTISRFVSASDGTLSVNYLTKATDAAGINESIVFDNGTNVGISESSPKGKFHVKAGSSGTAAVEPDSIGIFENSGNSYISILSPTAQYAGVVMGGPTNPYGSYVSWNHDNLALKVATNHTGASIQMLAGTEQEAMRITSSGNVGIGTTSPSTVLHISGSDGLIIPVGTTSERVNVQGAIRYNNQDQVFEGYDGANWGSLGGVKDVNQDTYITAEDFPGVNNDELKFFTFGTERMRILSGGKVGINIAQPVTTLHVSGSDAITIPFGSTSQRPSSVNVPLTGAIRLNTDIKDFEGYNGTNWRLLGDFTFTKNLTVSIDPTKSFGRYKNTDIIPSFGKTVSQVLEMAVVEPIPPGVFLSSSSTVLFNQSSIANSLTFSHFISSLGASVDTAVLEYRRNLTDSWTTINTSTLSSGTFVHSFTDPLPFSGATNAAGSNVIPFYYRYVVTDTIGAMASASVSITPQTYSTPSTNTPSIGSTTRYRGDINTTYSATLTRNRLYVPITSYQLQRSLNSGAWTNIGSLVSVSGDPSTISISISDNNDTSIRNADTVQYRLAYTDGYVSAQSTATNSNTSTTITFVHRNALILNTNASITIADIDNASIVGSTLPGAILSNSKNRTINDVTALAGQYTYYAYAAAAGNLVAVIQDGALPVLGAFGSPADITGTNVNGSTVTYRVYRTNSTQAFTLADLVFS
jgi:hypothetical protein